MLGLSRPLIPVVVLSLIAIASSYFVSYAWIFPLVAIPGYIGSLLTRCTYERIKNNCDADDKIFGAKIPTYFNQNRAACSCNGIGIWRYIVINKNYRGLSGTLDAMSYHEIAHLYYSHPLINALYYTCCSIVISILLTINCKVFALVAVFCMVPLTICKTIEMEIFADRLADKYSDMKAYLKVYVIDSSVRKIRMAALSGRTD